MRRQRPPFLRVFVFPDSAQCFPGAAAYIGSLHIPRHSGYVSLHMTLVSSSCRIEAHGQPQNSISARLERFQSNVTAAHGFRERESPKPISGVEMAFSGASSSDGPKQGNRQTSPHGRQRVPTAKMSEEANRAQRQPSPEGVVEENDLASL